MNDLLRRLDSADVRLRHAVARVRSAPAAPRPAEPVPAPVPLRPTHLRPATTESALDQSIAALQAVVWIASFIQSIFNEIRGRADV